MNALFLSPHPDDVELFCGGTVARLAARGPVVLVDFTRGEMSSNGDPVTREREASAAAEALGVTAPREQLGLPDAGLSVDDPEQVRAVIGVLRRHRPRLVFAPWPQDRHPDHVAAGEIARRATELAATAASPELGEPHAIARLLHYPCHGAVEPHLLVDVSATVEAWERAVRSYRSQFLGGEDRVPTPINRPGFLEHHRQRRARWGQWAGTGYAEGFLVDGPWPLALSGLLED